MKPPPFTPENIRRWLHTRDLPEGISLRCVLEELLWHVLVLERMKGELAKATGTLPMLLDVQHATDDEGTCNHCGRRGEIVRGL